MSSAPVTGMGEFQFAWVCSGVGDQILPGLKRAVRKDNCGEVTGIKFSNCDEIFGGVVWQFFYVLLELIIVVVGKE